MQINNYLPFFLLLILLVAVIYSFFFLGSGNANAVSRPIAVAIRQVCTDGGTLPCENSLGCTGERICVNNAWTGCITKKICEPGAKAACIENSCMTGYKICNECGTGYGKCIR